MESLPNEILSDIFTRLLAKQLAQMRCVSKSWNALLSESSFVKSHLHRSTHQNDEILLFIHDGFCSNCTPLTARCSRSPDVELTNFIKLPVNPCFGYEYAYGNVIGSVHGLICFSYESCTDCAVYIWNPSLSAVLTLPPYSWPYTVGEAIAFRLRFGFDPKTDDYKVVKLTSLSRPPRTVPEVEVYSMRKGSWELITQKLPSHITRLSDQDEVCEDGHLYWLGCINGDLKLQTIVAFDLGAETFCQIPLPDCIQNSQVYGLNVFRVFGGKLCVMSRVNDGKHEVWVMDEYGVVESWFKHHAFSQFNGDIIPYGFTSHNEFIFKVDDDQFALYDPIADKAKTFRIPILSKDTDTE